jgi:hypothetical protein
MASWMNVPENIQRTQLDHILHNVLRLPNGPNEPVHVALNRARVRTLSYLVERPTANINALTYQPAGNDADGNSHPVQHLEDYLKLRLKLGIGRDSATRLDLFHIWLAMSPKKFPVTSQLS